MPRIGRYKWVGGCRSDAGTATIEFALVAPLLLVLLFGIAELGLVFEDLFVMRSAARTGARSGSVGTSVTIIEDQVIEAAASLNSADLTITQQFGTQDEGSWSWQSLEDESTGEGVINNAPSGSYIKISLSYPHLLLATTLIPGLEDEPGSGIMTITAETIFRRE